MYVALVTGQDTYELFAGWPIWYYSVELDPCCQLPSGWVSIQGGGDPACWFLWHNSLDGDLASWQYDESADPDSQWSAAAYDMSICLTTAETGPGCYEYLPGDVNMYSGNWPPAAIGGDVTYLVGRFRGVPTSVPCNFTGDLPAPFWASADANGDCNVIGSDVTKLVSVFRGIGSINYCGDQIGDTGHFEPCWHTPTELPPARPAGWPPCE
jgi:hypothetical protein